MKALCIPGTFCPKDYGLTGSHQKAGQWTVLTFDDEFCTRYAALCNTPSSEAASQAVSQ